MNIYHYQTTATVTLNHQYRQLNDLASTMRELNFSAAEQTTLTQELTDMREQVSLPATTDLAHNDLGHALELICPTAAQPRLLNCILGELSYTDLAPYCVNDAVTYLAVCCLTVVADHVTVTFEAHSDHALSETEQRTLIDELNSEIRSGWGESGSEPYAARLRDTLPEPLLTIANRDGLTPVVSYSLQNNLRQYQSLTKLQAADDLQRTFRDEQLATTLRSLVFTPRTVELRLMLNAAVHQTDLINA